jgi:predicted DNA-binding transcriptional regulator YafY
MQPRSRPPTYGTATRLARILYGLLSRPYGWALGAIQDELSISERTLLRYLAACRKELVDARGEPILEIVRRGERRLLRFSDAVHSPETTSYQALSFYFALTVLSFLDGTIMKEGVADLWERFRKALPPRQQARLADFGRKFYTVPYAVKDYAAFDDTLDTLLRALVDQRTISVVYTSPWHEGEPRTHEFDPYTLTLYRGGLYLIGRSHTHRKIVYLAVERMRAVTLLDRRFEYPKTYPPERHTDGVFGIVEGPETEVAIRIMSAEGAELLSSRRLHRTQRFVKQADGTTLLTMTVRGTEELKNWVLSLGPHVEVVRPETLRQAVRDALEAAALRYRR